MEHVTIGGTVIVTDQERLRIALTRGAAVRFWSYVLFFPLWGVLFLVSMAPSIHDAGSLALASSLLVISAWPAWIIAHDGAVLPIAFDHRTDRIEQRGRVVGRLSEVLKVVVSNEWDCDVPGNVHYKVCLAVSTDGPGPAVRCLELGSSSTGADMGTFSARISEFLGVGVVEVNLQGKDALQAIAGLKKSERPWNDLD